LFENSIMKSTKHCSKKEEEGGKKKKKMRGWICSRYIVHMFGIITVYNNSKDNKATFKRYGDSQKMKWKSQNVAQ
jgi:hypothetical protein